MRDKPKFCKDCKYFTFTRLCQHPNNGFDLVTGEMHYVFADCNREGESLCGKGAKWFEPKPLKPEPPPTTETMYKSGGVYSNNQPKEVKPWYKFW